MPQEQEQNTVQPQETAKDDFSTWEAQRNAELTGQSAAGEEKPAAESADDSETAGKEKEPEGEKSADEPEEESEGEDEDEKKDEDEGEKPKRRKGGFEKRIGRLTKQNSELAAQNRELAERLAALEKGKPAAEDKPAATDDDPEPQEEDFDSFSDYVKATTKWTYRQEQKAKAAEEAEAKAKAEAETRKQKAAEGWNDRVAEARKQFSDYDEVLEDAADIEVSAELESALLEAGPAVIYHLAKNRDEAERIAKLPTASALREIGKIEAQLSAKPAKEPTPTPKPKTTSAPKPPPPLSGKSSAPRGLDDPDLSFDEFERLRQKQLLGR